MLLQLLRQKRKVAWTRERSGHAEEWASPRCILKEVATGFPGTLDIGCERKSRGSEVFGQIWLP